MRFFLLFILLHASCLTAVAQVQKIDSLTAVLDALPADSDQRLEPMMQLIQANLYANPERAASLIEALGELSRKLESSSGKADYHLMKGSYMRMYAPSDAVFAHLDSAEQYYTSVGNLRALFGVYSERGTALSARGQIVEAVEEHQKQIAIAKYLNEDELEANALLNLGPKLMWVGKVKPALKALQNAAAIFRSLGEKIKLAQALGNIGFYYLEQQLPLTAEPYILTAHKLITESDQKGFYALAHAQRAFLYQELKDTTQSIVYLRKAVEAAKAVGDQSRVVSGQAQLGQLYFHTYNYDKAEPLLENSIDAVKAMGRYDQYLFNATALAIIKIDKGEKSLARQYLNASAAQVESLEDPLLAFQIARRLGRGYYQLGDYAKAAKFFSISDDLTEQVNDEQEAEEIGRLTAKYQFEEQQKIEVEQQQQAEKEALARNRRQLMMVFAMLGVIISGLMFIRRLRIPRRIRDGMLFFSMLMLFESVVMIIDPYIMANTGGMPIPTLVANGLLAGLFTLLHGRLEVVYHRMRRAS